MRSPKTVGTLSDSAALAWDDFDQTVAKLIYKNVITDDFANLNNWTETDADSKVNLTNNIITMDGGNAWGTHGLVYTAGVSRARGYFELKYSSPSLAAVNFAMSINNTNTLVTPVTSGVMSIYGPSSLALRAYNGTNAMVGDPPYAASTYYTVRLYIDYSADGSTWKGWKATIQGGIYTNETPLFLLDTIATAYATTLYFTFQRYASSSGALVSFKEFRWYSGYDTGNPYVEWIHDAGVGKVFDNFDMTALAMPGSMSSTNLNFSYSFDDGSASYSAYQTLANFNGNGKITGRHRYIRIRVNNALTDGTTQVYIAKPDSDTFTDGIGDFPNVANTLNNDTVQGTTGTATAPAATDLRKGVQCGAGGTGVQGTMPAIIPED